MKPISHMYSGKKYTGEGVMQSITLGEYEKDKKNNRVELRRVLKQFNRIIIEQTGDEILALELIFRIGEKAYQYIDKYEMIDEDIIFAIYDDVMKDM